MVKTRDGSGAPAALPRSAGQVMGAGLQFAGAILLFLFLGRWLDARLGTEPWLLIGGVVLGSVGGFVSLYRQLVVRPDERARRQREGGSW